ncbi:MAG TPA: hypothetical protein VGI39_16350 [Polyangiaceae bacterium]|jgi:predicted methyltransferase
MNGSFRKVVGLTSLALIAACSKPQVPPAAPSASSAQADAEVVSATARKLRAALAGTQRTAKERTRDAHRHPTETLEFFNLKDDQTVVEISPGEGWYTAILAPVLLEKGKLIIAGGDPNGDPASESTQNAMRLKDRLKKMPAVFGKVEPVVLRRDEDWVLGPPDSADLVVTFRNFHNWVEAGRTEKVLRAIFAVLKHGGVLGITDHRANAGAPTNPDAVAESGYLPQDFVVKTVEAAGFKFVASSDVNANAKDTKDHPKGVWTLPPTLELGDKDREKYETIGESDRMTLKFAKP